MYLRRKINIDVPTLISAVKQQECIWNVENRDYNRRCSMASVRAWADVTNKVGKEGVTSTDLRAKWKNLKDAYRKDFKKNFVDGEYRGLWQYFQEMDFLRDSVINTTQKEKPEEPALDDDAEEQEVYHEGMVYKRKPDPFVVKLITAVKQNECLWNKDDFPVSKPSTRKTMRAWNDIAEKLGIPMNTLRKKWKNLRYSYRKEIQKHYSDGEYKGIWQYFNMLSFLKIDYIEISNDEESEEDESMMENNGFEDTSRSNDMYNQVKIEVEAIDNPLDYARQYQEEMVPAKRPRHDDEYDLMFLKSLVPFFRGMDPVRKLVLRSKIQDLVISELASTS